jgi:aspartate ammonia-lyase
MTLGQEFSTYAVMLMEDQQRLREAALLIQEINLGATAIGIVTALNPYIGYENAGAVAKEAYATGKGVAEIVLAKGLLTQEQLADILCPKKLTQPR